MRFNGKSLPSLLLASTALVARAGEAQAQGVAGPQAPAAPPLAAGPVDRTPANPSSNATAPGSDGSAPTSDAAAPAEIVVTGSRVISDAANSPTPLTVVSTQQLLTTTPTNVPDALIKLPVFLGSPSGRSTNDAGRASTSRRATASRCRRSPRASRAASACAASARGSRWCAR